MWILMCTLSQHWVYSSPSHLEQFSYSRCTVQLHMAEQARCFSGTVALADGSLHKGMCIILYLSFTIHKTNFLSANPCSEMGADAWSLTNCETFFLFEPYKLPFKLYFNEWFLITTRNQEVIKLVLFLNFQTPAEELEKRGWYNSLSWYRYLPQVSTSVILPHHCCLRCTDHSGTKSS